MCIIYIKEYHSIEEKRKKDCVSLYIYIYRYRGIGSWMDRSQSLCVLRLSCWLLAPYPAIERCPRPFDRAIIISQLSAPFISLTMVAAFPWYRLFCSIPANTSRRWCGSKCYIIMSSCEPPARPVNRVLYISYVYSLTRINHPSHHIICHVYNMAPIWKTDRILGFSSIKLIWIK